jgi:RNA polymerase sigma-70 factor (ECF subfamily)
LSLVRKVSWFEPDPEAVVQEVWLRVLKGAATYSAQAKVSTWLHRITVNETINAARRRQANRAMPFGELYKSHDKPERTDPGDPSLAVIDRVHAAVVLPDLLALLPRDQRLVLEVLHFDGLTNDEAAQLLGVAVGTVKSRAHRARATIAAHLLREVARTLGPNADGCSPFPPAPRRLERRARGMRQSSMTSHQNSSRAVDDLEASAASGTRRDATGRLVAAALDGDRRAEAALHVLGGFDDAAHRASWALLRADRDPAQPAPPDVLASIDRTLAALRDGQRSL